MEKEILDMLKILINNQMSKDTQMSVAMIGILGVLIGSFFSTFTIYIQHLLTRKNERRQRIYDEKKTAYFEFIKAVREYGMILESYKNKYVDLRTIPELYEFSKDFNIALTKVKLFASKEVIEAVNQDYEKDYTQYISNVTNTMKEDLEKII